MRKVLGIRGDWAASCALLLGGATLGAMAVLGLPAPAAAQSWPNRNIKFIIPFGPGAGADIGARLVAERLQKKWSQPIVVENRPGGDGIIAITQFVQANDDHTLLFAATGSFTVHPYQREKLPYELQRDILPIARVSNTLLGIGVPASLGVNSIKDVVDKAKADPGKLNVALVPGITEFVYDGFVNGEKINMVKVPYRDIVQAVPDVGENRIQLMMASVAILQPGMSAGNLKLIALNGKTRNEQLAPGVPTVREIGFPALEFDGLVGLLGPKVMSIELRRQIAADVIEAAKDPDVARRLASTMQAVNPGGPEEFGRAMNEQVALIDSIAKTLGIQKKQQ